MAQSAAQSSELTPAQTGDASKRTSRRPDGSRFWTSTSNETLIVLSDLMIPRRTRRRQEALGIATSDLVWLPRRRTPTGVPEFSWLSRWRKMRRSQSCFRYVSREEQDDLLHGLAYPRTGSGWAGDTNAGPIRGTLHFEALKRRIMNGLLQLKDWRAGARLGRSLCARQL